MSGMTPPPGEAEVLELGKQPAKRPRRGLLVGIVAGVVVALGIPLGAFAAFQLLSGGGTQPHDVLPANAVGYFRVDLDPTAPEKIDAVRFLRTFPAFEKYTRIDDERADVREAIFDAIVEGSPCELDYQDDVAPWLGERLGVAVTAPAAGDREPGVVAAIQVSDEQGARQGLAELRSCDPDGAPTGGWDFLDGYMIVAETNQQAEDYAAAAARSPLADNEQFSSDMDRLGEQGVASMWFSGDGIYQAFNSTVIGDPGPAGSQFDLMRDEVKRQIDRSYRSGAVAFRFDDRYVELATVVTGSGYQEPEGDSVADMRLPETTAVAFGFANGAEYVDQQWEMLLQMADDGASSGMLVPMGHDNSEQTAREIERALGLQLPADLQTLVGDSFTLALDGAGLDLDALAGSGDPSMLDLGARVRTDAAGFTRVIETLESKAAQNGLPLDLVVKEGDEGVVAALNDGYADRLVESGSLTDTDVFNTAVPDADEAQAVFFLNLDALEQPIIDAMRQAGGHDAEVVDNFTKVEALGISGGNHDGYAEGALRITVAD